MIPTPRRAFLLALLACAPLACRTAPASGLQKKTYTLVFLVTGPNSATIGADEKKEVFAGHMANIKRLADEDKLLIAGPFGEQKPDGALRGIFILDTPDLATAKTWTETDPGVQKGEFAAEYAAFRSPSPLHRSLELWRAEEKNGTAGDAPRVRKYAMVFAHEAERAEYALGSLRKEGKVSFEGNVDGSNRGTYLAVLDAEDVRDAALLIGDSSIILRERDIASWMSAKTVAAIPHSAAN